MTTLFVDRIDALLQVFDKIPFEGASTIWSRRGIYDPSFCEPAPQIHIFIADKCEVGVRSLSKRNSPYPSGFNIWETVRQDIAR
jgi:hypothetical protein